MREATLLEISHTSRPAIGGSDASWEGTGEDDSEEEEDEDEELASTCGQDAGSQDEWGYGGAVGPILPLGAPLSYSAMDQQDEDSDQLASHSYDRYHGHSMAHSAGLLELTNHPGWAADLASTLSVKTVRMKSGRGRGGGSSRGRRSEAEWVDEDRDGWCADSMAVECSDEGDEDDLPTVIEEEQTLSIHTLSGQCHTHPTPGGQLSMRPPEGFTSRRRVALRNLPDSLAMAPIADGQYPSRPPNPPARSEANLGPPEFMDLGGVCQHSDWGQDLPVSGGWKGGVEQ
jgi:hypothetical protein